MELIVRLEPRIDPCEDLLPGLTERKTIKLETNGITSVILGRGTDTGISDRNIGRNIVKISLDEFSRDEQSIRATLLKDAERCEVHINGIRFPENNLTAFLSSGDVISLDRLRYEYRVHLSLEGDDHRPKRKRQQQEVIEISSPESNSADEPIAAVAAHPAEETAVSIPPKTAQVLSDEIQCSVCLEIQFYPRTLDPCGHSVCLDCAKRLKHCPQCRERIEAHIPAMQLHNLICTLISVPSLLDKDDVAHFRKKLDGLQPTYQCKEKSAKHRRSQRSRRAGTVYDPIDHHDAPSYTTRRTSSRRIEPLPLQEYADVASLPDLSAFIPPNRNNSYQPVQNLQPLSHRTESVEGASSLTAITID
eukprot:scaffold2553_cov138-Cylindrotheca_fusiformis.AAC.2